MNTPKSNTMHFVPKKLAVFVCMQVLLFSCAPRQLMKPYEQAQTQRQYAEGVGDAAKPQAWEISSNLIAVKKENSDLVWKDINGASYLLVSSWKADTTYYKNDAKSGFYNTGKYPIWVTAAPELQQRCQSKKFGRKEGLDLRLKQLFGMPPGVDKKYFVEFWVRPKDLYRPCPDPEISDTKCGLAFPEAVTDHHKDWINNQRLMSYFNPAWDQNYPWTQLGYTYDWNPKNKRHVGLSEFIIGENAEVVVKGFQTTEEYCALPE